LATQGVAHRRQRGPAGRVSRPHGAAAPTAPSPGPPDPHRPTRQGDRSPRSFGSVTSTGTSTELPSGDELSFQPNDSWMNTLAASTDRGAARGTTDAQPRRAHGVGTERNGVRRATSSPCPTARGHRNPAAVESAAATSRRPTAAPSPPRRGTGAGPSPTGGRRAGGGRSGGLTALPASPGKGCYPPGSHSQACPWSEKKERILGVLKGPRDLIGGCFDLIETLACNQIAFPSQATGRSQGAGCPQPPRGSRAQSPPGGSATRRPPTGPQGRRRGHLGGTASHPPAPPPGEPRKRGERGPHPLPDEEADAGVGDGEVEGRPRRPPVRPLRRLPAGPGWRHADGGASPLHRLATGQRSHHSHHSQRQ